MECGEIPAVIEVLLYTTCFFVWVVGLAIFKHEFFDK